MQQFMLPYFADSQVYFTSIEHLSTPVYLDSQQRGRYDIISADPAQIITHHGSHTYIDNKRSTICAPANSFQIVKNALQSWNIPLLDSDLPFTGGAIGYFGYDLARQIEDLPHHTQIDMQLPDMFIGIYDWAMIIDHLQQKAYYIYRPEFNKHREGLYEEILSHLAQPPKETEPLVTIAACQFTSNISYENYAHAFTKIQNYLYAGDIYEICYTQRFNGSTEHSPWSLYQSLCQLNPAPFSAFISLNKDMAVLSVSPEQFLQVRHRRVQTKPIKGTRPRGKTPQEDQDLQNELANSEKDQAENLMIVDLLRNDLGKCCEVGSIQVEKLFAIESFATVHHMVSTITGKLTKDTHPLDLLEQCFPGGSITGAPKIRAMEIIEELEPQRRNVYCGSIAYIDFNGHMDSNIAIRTLIYDHGRVHCSAGGAIVVDSVLENEYQECLDKVKFLF